MIETVDVDTGVAKTASDMGLRPGTAYERKRRNNYRHGMHSGLDPVGCSYVTKLGSRFRNDLENCTLECHGEITVVHAATIAHATAAFKHSLKARRWLKESFDELSYDQRLAFSREEPRALEQVRKAIKDLDLERPSDLFDAIPSLDAQGAVLGPYGGEADEQPSTGEPEPVEHTGA